MAGFGEQLRKLRESKNMSIRDYADLIPLSVSYLSEIERGLKPSPGMAMIEKIAEVLDVKPDYFDEYKAEKVREAVIEDPRLALLFRQVMRLSRKEREEVLTFSRGITEKRRSEDSAYRCARPTVQAYQRPHPHSGQPASGLPRRSYLHLGQRPRRMRRRRRSRMSAANERARTVA